MALYLEHFGLKEPPFRITPHTDFFFDGADRGATLEALIYAVLHDEGIVKVSGEVGSGKTMLCRVLMERLPSQVDTIYLATASLAREEILQAIADELDVRFSQERRTVALRELQEHLIERYAAGRRVVILIDEAHVMPEAGARIARVSQGLTRRINIPADKSLLAAFTDNTHAVGERQARAAVADSEFGALKRRRSWRAPALVGAALAAGIVIGAAIP